MSDAARTPQHYKGKAIEHWDVVEAWGLDYLLGCATKYMSRHKEKGTPLLDIEKAIIYTTKYFDRLITEAFHNAKSQEEADALRAKAAQYGISLPDFPDSK